MFSLAIYTQIADPGLRNGRIVAGTGTIDRDGNVGDIGGIDKKVVASSREGAAIFFAPDNPVSEEEQKAHPDAKKQLPNSPRSSQNNQDRYENRAC